MKFTAKTMHVWYSPYKMRPLADVIRGKQAVDALQWLTMYRTKRSVPLYKVLASAVANAKDREQLAPADLVVSQVFVDQGPIRRYGKPGAQGRTSPQRSRQCHITVVVESKSKNKEV